MLQPLTMRQLFKEYYNEIVVPIFKDIKGYYKEMIIPYLADVKELFGELVDCIWSK